MMLSFLIPYSLGGIAGRALQSILACHVPPNEQEKMQGTFISLISRITIIGNPFMNNLFKFFTTEKAPVYFPGVFFLLAALFMLLSLIITWYVLSKERKLALQKII